MSAGRNVLPQGAHASTAIFRCVGDRGYVDGAFFSKWFGTSPPTLGRHLRTSPPACGRHVPISSPGRRDLRAAGPHLRAVGREVPPFGRHLRPPDLTSDPPDVRSGAGGTSHPRDGDVRSGVGGGHSDLTSGSAEVDWDVTSGQTTLAWQTTLVPELPTYT